MRSLVGALVSVLLAAGAAPVATSATVQVFGWDLDTPEAICADGTHVWVANNANQSVVELDEATGGRLRVLWGPEYGFQDVQYMDCEGGQVWTMNGGSVTDVNGATGVPRLVTAPGTDLGSGPGPIASDGTDVWVGTTSYPANNGQLTELDATTGTVVREIRGDSYGLDDPIGIAVDRAHVWVANLEGATVTEVDRATGALVQVISGAEYAFDRPVGLASDGAHVWVANSGNNSVTEIDASTGDLVKVFSGNYGVRSISMDGPYVFVTGPRTVAVLSTVTGSLVRLAHIDDGSFQPDGATADLGNVWLTYGGGGAGWVEEYSGATGALLRGANGSVDGFDQPEGVACDAGHVWAVDTGDGDLTGLDAATGALVHKLTGMGPEPQQGQPAVVADDGTHVWTVGAGSLAELSTSTGKEVGSLSGKAATFLVNPVAAASDGTHLWVLNEGTESKFAEPGNLVELGTSTLRVIRTIAGNSDAFSWVEDDITGGGLALDGGYVWLTNPNTNAVVEVDGATGKIVQDITAAADAFDEPDGVAADGSDVWVTNLQGNSVTELAATSGELVRVLSGPVTGYDFDAPGPVVADNGSVWVANTHSEPDQFLTPGGSVTEIQASTGDLVRVFSSGTYRIDSPKGICASGNNVWVTSPALASVTDIRVATGTVAAGRGAVPVLGANALT
jgi:hypothetical protein